MLVIPAWEIRSSSADRDAFFRKSQNQRNGQPPPAGGAVRRSRDSRDATGSTTGRNGGAGSAGLGALRWCWQPSMAADAAAGGELPADSDEQILAQMLERSTLGSEAIERREQELTLAELAAQREDKLNRERENQLSELGSEVSRLFTSIESCHSATSSGRKQPSEGSSSTPTCSTLKVGVALMTREPHCFDWWLRYHRSLGIDHIFVHVEDSPELLVLLGTPEFSAFVTVTNLSDKDDSRDEERRQQQQQPLPPGAQVQRESNYYSLIERQERHIRRSTQLAKQKGIDWLFHVDDDELLHFTVPMSTLIADLAPGTTCLALINLEAVPTSSSSACVFEEIKTFTLHKMNAYRNGKAAGALQAVHGGEWCGPHRFTGPCYVVPVAKARVLHFESCTYEAWRDKFLRHTHHCEGKKKSDIPFAFYRDSITLLQDDKTGGEDGAEGRWRAFYHERKIDHYASLKDIQKLRLTLRPDTPAMINAASTGPTEEEAKDRAMLEELD